MLHISSDLYKSEWLDLVFKNRNKNYGAYALRLQSGSITLRALFIAVPVFVLFFAGPMIYRQFHPESAIPLPIDKVVKIRDLVFIPPVEKVKPEQEKEVPKVEPVKEKIKMVKLPSHPVVVNEPVLVNPPSLTDIEKAVIGPVTQSGAETDLASGSAQGNVTIDNEIHDFKTIEAYPEFEGGMKAWTKFLQRNLRYPEMAREAGIQGKVFISFVIEKDGSVSNVTILKGIGAGCDEEAARVIKKSPKWKPGRQNNQNVRVRFNIPLSFTISE